jgi:hypothetical protein
MKSYWNKETCLEAIKQWIDLYDEPPTVKDWYPPPKGYPSKDIVIHHCGTWGAALRELGYPARRGRRAAHVPTYDELYQLAEDAGLRRTIIDEIPTIGERADNWKYNLAKRIVAESPSSPLSDLLNYIFFARRTRIKLGEAPNTPFLATNNDKRQKANA